MNHVANPQDILIFSKHVLRRLQNTVRLFYPEISDFMTVPHFDIHDMYHTYAGK